MPTYEYVCSKCNHQFEMHLTLEEHYKHKVECPKCHTMDVEQVPEPFYTVTAKKSWAALGDVGADAIDAVVHVDAVGDGLLVAVLPHCVRPAGAPAAWRLAGRSAS